MQYLCRYADESGRILEQVEEAASEGEIRERYAQQGVLLYSVRPRGAFGAALRRGVTGGGRKKIPLEQFLIFNQQFVTLIRAGLPILKALDLLSSRVAQPDLRTHILEVRDRVRTGTLLSESFAQQGVFPKIYVTSVMAGEKSGSLEEVLERYINYQRIALAVRKKILVSLIYPSILLTLVTALITFLTSYVIPSFAELYGSLDAELPPITQVMLAFGLAVRSYLPLMLLAIVAVVGAVLMWSRSATGAQALDKVKLNTPLAGEIWQKYQVAQFARMLATLLTGGIPLVNALETVRDSFTSHLIRNSMDVATRAVREGRALSAGLAATKVIPELAVEMVEVGESTGALPQMLNSVADFFEQDVETRMQAMLALVEPAILVVVSIVVSIVLVSLYLPIFSLAEKVH
jgi:type IV pilus assembly protein PilC